jgi:UDP-2,4-diacetamido-2,4,6-trideoxy-beta-L-altropyranose hydrolase
VKNVLFRVDSSQDMGVGHVIRCLTLADFLRNRGVVCTFVCREHLGSIHQKILERGHSLVTLPLTEERQTRSATNSAECAYWVGASWEDDASATLETLRATGGADWVIVDHYGLDVRWEAKVASGCSRLLVIDDLASKEHVCDLLLDQNYGRSCLHYAGLLSGDSVCLAGSAYALLRPDFPALRKASLERRSASPEVRHVLISLGGMDATNLTCRVLEALTFKKMGKIEKISVMMSSKAPWLELVRQKASLMPIATEVLTDVIEVAALMASADLAVGGVGVTALERCCMGLPTIGIILAENQLPGANALARAGALKVLNPDDFQSEFQELIGRLTIPEQLLAIQQACARVTDGWGAERVVDYILGKW